MARGRHGTRVRTGIESVIRTLALLGIVVVAAIAVLAAAVALAVRLLAGTDLHDGVDP